MRLYVWLCGSVFAVVVGGGTCGCNALQLRNCSRKFSQLLTSNPISQTQMFTFTLRFQYNSAVASGGGEGGAGAGGPGFLNIPGGGGLGGGMSGMQSGATAVPSPPPSVGYAVGSPSVLMSDLPPPPPPPAV